MSTQVKSTLAYIKQPDGNYFPVFYVNTADDVYVDIEKSLTLANMIDNGTIRNQIYNVDNDTERFALTTNEVKLHDLVNVYDKGSLYEVIDTDKLSVEDGYKKIIINDSTFLPLTRTSTSILETALSSRDDTMAHYMLQGDLYTGNDLPDQIYRYSSATVIRRYNVPSVILWGGPSGTNVTAPAMINHYTNSGVWTGWAPMGMTASDRNKLDVLFTKGATTLTANPSKVIYVDPVNGLDTNTGLTSDLSMQTIKGAIAKYGGLGNLNLRLADGEYNDTSVLTMNGLTRLVITGNITDISKIVIKFPMYTSDVPVYIDGVTIDVSAFPANQYTSSDNPYALLFRGATFSVTNSQIIGPGLNPNSAIIGRNGTIGYVSACNFANWNIAVRTETHSNIYCTRTTTSGDVNITYSAVNSTIEYTEDSSTPIQLVHAKNTSGIIIVDGMSTVESEIKSMIRSKNYLHNWDFSNAFIPSVSTRTGVGEFLGRWYSANAGNTVRVATTVGLTFTTSAANGMISQTLTKSLVNLLYRHLTFSIWVGESLTTTPDTRVSISIVTTNSAGVSTTVASASKTGAEITDGILYCSGLLSTDYVKLECRISLINANTSVTITKAKLEVGTEPTLRPTDAADKIEETLKCKDTDISGNPKNITNILYDKGYTELSADPIKVIYINPVTGNDNNDGKENAQMKTIRAAVTKYGGSGLLRLILANGEYTDNGILYINGVSSVTIQPASGQTNSVVIKFPIYFKYVPFYIEHITFDLSQFASPTFGVTARSCQFALSSCKIIGNGINGNMFGVVGTLGASGIVYLNDISACNIAVRSESGSTLNVSNATSLTNNRVGYSAIGGIISYNGDTMGATTLYEKSTSGVIFGNGNLTGGAAVTMADATLG